MSNIVLSENLFADFCRHISASVNVVDVLYKTRQFASPNFDANRDDPIMLAVLEPSLVPQLIEFEYAQFLQKCVQNLRLLRTCADVFLSEMESGTVELFEVVFERIAPQAWVDVTDTGFVIHAPAILADLIIFPIGRVHHEVLHSLDHFTKMLAAVDNDPAKLFLNAKAPTPESQYIQMWVANRLGISIAPPMGNILVV